MDTKRCPKCAGPLRAVPLKFTLASACERCSALVTRPQDATAVAEELALGGLRLKALVVSPRPMRPHQQQRAGKSA